MKKNLFIAGSMLLFSCTKNVNCGDITYKNGVSYFKGKEYTGDCVSNYLDNSPKSKQSYINGKDHGFWTFYYSNGNKRTEAYFDSGKRIGQWKYYASNRKIWKINSYDSLGQPTGKWETYDTLDGKLISKKDVREIFLNNE